MAPIRLYFVNFKMLLVNGWKTFRRLFVLTLIHLFNLVKELSLVPSFPAENKVTVVGDEILMQNFCDINFEESFY